MTIEYNQKINAPIETVFDCVDDEEKLKQWMTGLIETQYLSPKNVETPVGARFRQKIREGGNIVTYDGTITAYKKPEHLAVNISCKAFSVDTNYYFTANGGTTTLHYSCDIKYHTWVSKIIGTLFGFLHKRILDQQMKKLKALGEAIA